jgi:SAM-dependent methyltransferase
MNEPIPFSPSRLDATEILKGILKQNIRSPKKIIDVGCGKLFFYNILDELEVKGEYLGIDINPAELLDPSKKLVSKVLKENFLTYKIDQKFDLVACLWVLEHIKEDERAFKKISEITNKEGMLLLALPSVWSWPIELGRHGFHYYSPKNIIQWADKYNFEIINFNEAGGFLGLLFMLIYNWPRLLSLFPVYVLYQILFRLKLTHSSWENFSSKLVSGIFYRYHRYKGGLSVHNFIVKNIVEVDRLLRIFPASYLVMLKKK